MKRNLILVLICAVCILPAMVSHSQEETPAPLAGSMAPTFTSIVTNVIKPKCIYCHGNPKAPTFEMDMVSYEGLTGFVDMVNFDPMQSALYTETLQPNPAMPKGCTTEVTKEKGVMECVTVDESEAIATWIRNHAPQD